MRQPEDSEEEGDLLHPELQALACWNRDPTSVRSRLEEVFLLRRRGSRRCRGVGEPLTCRWAHVEDIGKVWLAETSDRRPEDEKTGGEQPEHHYLH